MGNEREIRDVHAQGVRAAGPLNDEDSASGPVTTMGRVYLVGAGPGDPDLITRRGLTCLRRADVVVYDRLVAPALLGEAPLHAERICAAKAPGSLRLNQREIEATLLDRARAGKTVVRLKGGDPFVFGRGGEEALALKEAGVPFEVVPGISSAVAVPAYAGIPVTHRNVSGGFAVWTAHRCTQGQANVIDAPTQVILMGVGTLPETVEELLARGRSPATPAAVISWGTTGRQRTVVGTLADIVDRIQEVGIEAPATIVVGDVAALSERLQWRRLPEGPRAGKRLVVTCRIEDADPVIEEFERQGAEVACLPMAESAAAPATELERADAEQFGADAKHFRTNEVQPVKETIDTLYDLVVEHMIDAVVFDTQPAVESFQARLARCEPQPMTWDEFFKDVDVIFMENRDSLIPASPCPPPTRAPAPP